MWSEVQLISREDIPGPVQEFQDAPGIPRFATVDGDEMTLYPAPNYTKANALRIYDTPEPTLFDAADTTETPSFPRFAHPILSLGVSIGYCNVYKPDRVPALLVEYRDLYSRLEDHLTSQGPGRGRVTASRTLAK